MKILLYLLCALFAVKKRVCIEFQLNSLDIIPGTKKEIEVWKKRTFSKGSKCDTAFELDSSEYQMARFVLKECLFKV